jgi:hypothetical protein
MTRIFDVRLAVTLQEIVEPILDLVEVVQKTT